jgi:hypothetical protein
VNEHPCVDVPLRSTEGAAGKVYNDGKLCSEMEDLDENPFKFNNDDEQAPDSPENFFDDVVNALRSVNLHKEDLKKPALSGDAEQSGEGKAQRVRGERKKIDEDIRREVRAIAARATNAMKSNKSKLEVDRILEGITQLMNKQPGVGDLGYATFLEASMYIPDESKAGKKDRPKPPKRAAVGGKHEPKRSKKDKRAAALVDDDDYDAADDDDDDLNDDLNALLSGDSELPVNDGESLITSARLNKLVSQRVSQCLAQQGVTMPQLPQQQQQQAPQQQPQSHANVNAGAQADTGVGSQASTGAGQGGSEFDRRMDRMFDFQTTLLRQADAREASHQKAMDEAIRVSSQQAQSITQLIAVNQQQLGVLQHAVQQGSQVLALAVQAFGQQNQLHQRDTRRLDLMDQVTIHTLTQRTGVSAPPPVQSEPPPPSRTEPTAGELLTQAANALSATNATANALPTTLPDLPNPPTPQPEAASCQPLHGQGWSIPNMIGQQPAVASTLFGSTTHPPTHPSHVSTSMQPPMAGMPQPGTWGAPPQFYTQFASQQPHQPQQQPPQQPPNS